MILEDATYDAFGYYSRDLKLQSAKLIIVACELCGEFRITSKNQYHTFCSSCSHRLGEAIKSDKNPNYGIHRIGDKSPNWKGGHVKCICLECGKKFELEKNRIKHGEGKYCSHSCAGKVHKGSKNPNYNGGKKAASARKNAKRKRQLGYVLIYPVEEGEHGHHFTNEYVGGIPADVHNSIGGSRKKHRTLVLEWLKANDTIKYEIVLCILKKEL